GRLRATSMIDARLDLLPTAARPLTHRARVRLHHGTVEVMARVVILQTEKAGSSIEPGGSALVQLRLEEPTTPLPGDRFIIRSYSPQVTIGGGLVIDALPEKHRIRDAAARARLEQLEAADGIERARLFIEMAGPRAMSASEIAARTGATDEQIAEFARKLVESGKVLTVTSTPLVLLSMESYNLLASRLIELLADYHKREPLALGLSREEARERIHANLKPEVFRACITRITEEGKIAAERDALRLASHKPALTDQDATAKQALEAAFKSAGLKAGTLEEVAASAGIAVERARKLLSLLAADRRVQRIGDFVFHVDAIEDLKSRIRAQKAVNPKIDVAVFKEITGGLTRKYAIPLLEFLDRERITRRVGNEREIL